MRHELLPRPRQRASYTASRIDGKNGRVWQGSSRVVALPAYSKGLPSTAVCRRRLPRKGFQSNREGGNTPFKLPKALQDIHCIIYHSLFVNASRRKSRALHAGSWFTSEHACTTLPALPLTPQTDASIYTNTSVRRMVAAVTGIQVKRQNAETSNAWGQTVDNQGSNTRIITPTSILPWKRIMV